MFQYSHEFKHTALEDIVLKHFGIYLSSSFCKIEVSIEHYKILW